MAANPTKNGCTINDQFIDFSRIDDEKVVAERFGEFPGWFWTETWDPEDESKVMKGLFLRKSFIWKRQFNRLVFLLPCIEISSWFLYESLLNYNLNCQFWGESKPGLAAQLHLCQLWKTGVKSNKLFKHVNLHKEVHMLVYLCRTWISDVFHVLQ